MYWKLPAPIKKRKIETSDKQEASRLKKLGFTQKTLSGDRYVLEKKLQKWEIFEEKIGVLLDSLGFEDTAVGSTSWLGRYQIDAAGGYEGTFLVFECKSTGQPRQKKITTELNIFAGKRAEIERAIREKYKTKYNEVKFIMAIDDMAINELDERTAKENEIYLWGSSYLKTSEELFSLIGPATVHYVLKELDVAPKLVKDDEGGADYKVPCFRVTTEDQQIFSFFLPADKLLNLVYVFRLQPGNEDAYQRFIAKNRILGPEGITEFINNGGFFKTSVVCSFERPVKFDPRSTGLLLASENVEYGILSIPKLYGTVWVIDGQHRIYGYANANSDKKSTNIGVVAYQDIEKKRQARDFIDINQKQKSVDPNTLWDLLSQTDPDSLQGAITKVAKGLNKGTVFKNKILIPGKAYHRKKSSYPLKLATVCAGLYDRKLLEATGRDNLYRRTEDVTDSDLYPESVIGNAINVLDQYFSLVWEIAGEIPEWRNGFVLHNNGFNILLRVLVEILKFQRGIWDRPAVKKLIEQPLSAYFREEFEGLKDLRTFTSNEAGRAKIALEIVKKIHSTNDRFAHEYIRDAEKRERLAFEKTEPYQTLQGLEDDLRRFIEESLAQVSKNWWKERIPLDVQEKANNRRDKSDSPWPWIKSQKESLISFIDFPDYSKIIQRRDNWNNVFVTTFKDEGVIVSKLKELEDIRNKIAHMRSLSVQESTTLRLYADKIRKAIGRPETDSKI